MCQYRSNCQLNLPSDGSVLLRKDIVSNPWRSKVNLDFVPCTPIPIIGSNQTNVVNIASQNHTRRLIVTAFDQKLSGTRDEFFYARKVSRYIVHVLMLSP